MEKRLYWFWLVESGLRSRKEILLRQFGTVEEIYRIFVEEKGVKVSELVQHCLWFPGEDELMERLNSYEKRGIQFYGCEEEEYPRLLREIYDAPCGLYVRGQLPKEKRCIAVVGARACTERGKVLTERLAEDLALSGIGVISGMAMGVDGAAHRGALLAWKNDGKGMRTPPGGTYAVLGNGVDICYPRSNRYLFDQLAEMGGLISEYPPGTPSLPAYFPQRNRIISGIADGILVIEARRRSGSLITAELGLEQGRNIYAIPGRPDDVLSEGCNYLIQTGAKLTLNVTDILSDFDFEQRVFMDSGKLPKILLETTEKIVYACLRLEPKHVNQIQRECGLEWNQVLSILLKLELKGYAEQTSMDCYVVSRR